MNLRKITVRPGMKFLDEARNRDLTVHERCEYDPAFWMCSVPISEVLYRYEDTFILKHRVDTVKP